jgi:hypothetical protein
MFVGKPDMLLDAIHAVIEGVRSARLLPLSKRGRLSFSRRACKGLHRLQKGIGDVDRRVLSQRFESCAQPGIGARAPQFEKFTQEASVGVELARHAEPGHFRLGIDAVDQHASVARAVERAFVDQSGNEVDRAHLAHQ